MPSLDPQTRDDVIPLALEYLIQELQVVSSGRCVKVRLEPSDELTYGRAATIAVGAIEIAYCAWKFFSVDDDIMRLHYLEKSTAVALDLAIFLSPVAFWAALVLGVFIVLSYVVPDPVAREVCSSPGSLISFWIEYAFWGDETIPSVFCNVAYNEAQSLITDVCIKRNERDMPTRIFLPGE